MDPGIGFGKRKEQNTQILARLGELARLDLPVMVGPSRKSFLAQTGEIQTRFATAAAVVAATMDRFRNLRRLRLFFMAAL